MNRRFFPTLLIAMLTTLSAFAAGDDKKEKKPSGLPDTTESAKLVAKMPKTVGGTVFLDKKPLAGVRVTDGVDFVTTDAEGKYTITLKPDPVVPYLPSRTISVCWPSGTWPARQGKSGPYQWWARLKEVKDPENVHFDLTRREAELPLCVVFGTDPHDVLTGAKTQLFRKEIGRVAGHFDFAVMGGDLGYLGFGNAERDYAGMKRFTDDFPVMLLHCIGNHDIVGVHSKWWKIPHELAGNGAFIKYLHPIRWSFDMADIHFVGLDWSLIDEKGHLQCGINDSTIDWLEKDLKSVPEGRPTYLFSHQWGEERFSKVCSKYGVKLCLAGHSHRNMFLGDHGGAQYWTKMSYYTLLYVDRGGFEFVDRCIYKGGRNGWDGHWRHHGRGCAVFTDQNLQNQQRGEHTGLVDLKLDSNARSIKPVKGSTYDLRVGARETGGKPAKRFGMRITADDGKVYQFVYDREKNQLNLMGREMYFNRQIPGAAPDVQKEQSWLEMRVSVMPIRVRVRVNSRLHYQKFIVLPAAKKIEVFAEEGEAEFGRVDLWQRTYPKDWNPRATANSG